MKRSLTVAMALALLAPPAALPECKERVVEWVKTAETTTKTVKEDGVLVYKNTWVKLPSGESRALGPGDVTPDGKPAPRTTLPPRKPTPPRPAPVKRTPTPSVPSSQARVVALSLVGIPHRAGGTDPRTGVNTTGLVKAYFDQLGVSAPREMLPIFRWGEFTYKPRIQAGDLVFHHSEGKGRPVPNMVGIALGNNEMIYMSGSKKKVLRVSYDSPWWDDRYMGARRVLGTGHARPLGTPPPIEVDRRVFSGKASFYGCGDGFDGSGTASGERFDATKMTAAHFDLPFDSKVEVTNLSNGKSVTVRINDRGPFEKQGGRWVRHSTRVLDLSCRAAELLGFRQAGLANVRARVLQ